MGHYQTPRAKDSINLTRMLLTTALLCAALSVNAQPMATGATETQFSVNNVTQFKTDLNQGGDFDWYSFDAGLRVRHQVNLAFKPRLCAETRHSSGL